MFNDNVRISDGFSGERAIVTPYSVRNQLEHNPVTNDLFITHIGYYPSAENHFRERPKGADENIFILCNEGKGSIIINNEKFILEKDHFFIIPALVPHRYEADKYCPWSIFWMHFKGSQAMFYSGMFSKLIRIDSRLDDRIKLFEEIFQTLEMGYSPDNLEYSSSCLRFFFSSLKYSEQFSRVKELTGANVVEKGILLMKSNLGNKLTLDQIASKVNYSAAHFGNLFLAKTSYSPMVYYNQLKIQKACSLLQFSDMKIKEIADFLGYFDQFHFSKAFKQRMEISPNDYRKRYQYLEKLD